MRTKTFLAAYLLFLGILFTSLGIVSFHMTNSTVYMLQEKSTREFQTITISIARDIAAMYARFQGGTDFHTAVSQVIDGYALWHNIELDLTHALYTDENRDAIVSFIQQDGRHFISITGRLPNPIEETYSLTYLLDITDNITEMQQIQRVLWITSIIVSLVAAVFLYIILIRIFKPLEIVSSASRQIAYGQYGKRIPVKGRNELASMATAFNRMAEQIERQIHLLENEAQQKQQFVDNFAHEIRTPLTSIYGYAEYLQKATLSEDELIESSGYIMSEAAHMKNIANSLLELATLRNYKPNNASISIVELFEDVKQSLYKPLKERGVKLLLPQLDVTQDLVGAEVICNTFAPNLIGQPDLIKTLLLNLCTNAITSCTSGVGVVYMSAITEGGRVVLTVSDNGCGISKDNLHKVAEPFFRVDKVRSRGQGGVGLGMALCKQIAEVHGASMTIESAIGVGTTIKVTFPNSSINQQGRDNA